MTKPYIDISRAAQRERDRKLMENRARQREEANLGDMYDPDPKPFVRPMRKPRRDCVDWFKETGIPLIGIVLVAIVLIAILSFAMNGTGHHAISISRP